MCVCPSEPWHSFCASACAVKGTLCVPVPVVVQRGYVFHHSIAFVHVERLTRESWFNVFRKKLV